MRLQLTGDDEPPLRPLPSYQTTARSLGERFLALVRPIRVLDAVRWDASIGRDFLATDGRDLPNVTRESYRPLSFDPAVKRRSLLDLERETLRRLGGSDPLGRLLRRRCRQARAAVDLLSARGTHSFAPLARELYGNPSAAEDERIEALFRALIADARPSAGQRTIDARAAAEALTGRLEPSLSVGGRFRVRPSDRLISDAAASGRSIKLRRAARFSTNDIALLAVHEGLVHVGTTLNARRQLVCSFLGHCTPATTAGQEGLAVLCELLAGVSHAGRLRRLYQRYRAVRMADAGADFRDVYRYFLTDSDDPADAYQQTARVFRGSLPEAGPFAKDATYALGLVRLLRAARRHTGRLALLFVGKTSPVDLPLLTALRETGVVEPPAVLPAPFDDGEKLLGCLRALPHAAHPLPHPHIRPAACESAAPHRAFSLLAARDSLCFE